MMSRLFYIAGLLVFLGPALPTAATGQALPADGDEARILHLLNRATFGPRPGDAERIAELGIEGWLDRQLDPGSFPDPATERIQERFPLVYLPAAELVERMATPRELQEMRRRLQDSTTELSRRQRRSLQRDLARRGPGRVLGEMTAAKLTRAALSERQLEEVMTDFWLDHFNVFWGKGADRWLLADYEQRAIRPNVFGSFEDLLVATATHPAMLFYLDNWRSMAPDTSAIRARYNAALEQRARRRMLPTPAQLEERLARLPGLNENYARELLELHTLGVDGGYTQADVMEVARVFTGWTLQMPENPEASRQRRRPARPTSPDGDYGFVFRDDLHDQGTKTVLGRSFDADGHDEGLAVLHMLATHPSTARHVATQLATRFVADDPPPELVDELARVFTATEGDLAAVTRALFTSEHFYAPQHVGARVKSPVVLVASALRATGAEVTDPRAVIETLRSLEQPLYLAEAPTGYEERSAGWASSGAMLARMNFGISLAAGQLRGVRVDGRALARQAEEAGPTPLEGLAAVVLPGHDTHELLALIREDLAVDPPSDGDEAGTRALGLILGSPQFQRH